MKLKKKIIFLSTVCDNKSYKILSDSSSKPISPQMQKYNQSLLNGLKEFYNISAISYRPVVHFIKKKNFKRETYKDLDIDYIYTPIVNFKFLKFIFSIFFTIHEIIQVSRKHKEAKIICDTLNPTSLISAYLSSFLIKTQITGYVTDIPGIMDENDNPTTIKKIANKIHIWLINKCDKHILLSKYMIDYIKSNEYKIIEGQYDITIEKKKNKKLNNKKIIMYAGTIDKGNGIDKFVEIIKKIKNKKIEFHFYGAGSYSDELSIYSKKDKRVKFFGHVSYVEISKKQLIASLLIITRGTEQLFTKYSFPSKLIEYMASGTAVLSTKISSIPREYFKYIFSFDMESISIMKKNIETIMNLKEEDLIKKGKEARGFILKNKNNIIQTKKIQDLIEK